MVQDVLRKLIRERRARVDHELHQRKAQELYGRTTLIGLQELQRKAPKTPKTPKAPKTPKTPKTPEDGGHGAVFGNRYAYGYREKNEYRESESPGTALSLVFKPGVPRQRFRTLFGPLELVDYLKGYCKEAKKLGEGVSGVAYEFRTIRTGFTQVLLDVAGKSAIVGPSAPSVGEDVIMKIIRASDHEELTREIKIMQHLERAPAVVVGDKTFRAADYVPRMYAAGDVDRDSFILMSRAPGDILKKETGLDAATLATLEKALLTLWLSGVSHSDMHAGNIMLDKATGTLSVIDYGMAVRLAPEASKAIRANLLALAALDGPALAAALKRRDVLKELVSKGVVTRATNSAFRHDPSRKEYVGYHTNERIMTYHVSRSCVRPACSRTKLAAARLASWVPAPKKK